MKDGTECVAHDVAKVLTEYETECCKGGSSIGQPMSENRVHAWTVVIEGVREAVEPPARDGDKGTEDRTDE